MLGATTNQFDSILPTDDSLYPFDPIVLLRVYVSLSIGRRGLCARREELVCYQRTSQIGNPESWR
jgi:hypothetical protein